ncbi:MAG TPA: peptidase M23, partial [Pseudogracilibacillus sp.]|nr:peptidase M23 [Pseudogracilibacillus sp.]
MQLLYRCLLIGCIVLIIGQLYNIPISHADDDEEIDQTRLALYKKTEAVTLVPWYYLAAMDQYERNINKDADDEIVAIQFPDEIWYGIGNNGKEKNANIVHLFNGIGQDGNGDGKADPSNPEDKLLATGKILATQGLSDDDIKISLWNHYQRDLTVKTIVNIAKVFKHFQSIELKDRDFPVDIGHNYSYQNTWGDRRGFGGNRIHEGTDIFANYGTPV